MQKRNKNPKDRDSLGFLLVVRMEHFILLPNGIITYAKMYFNIPNLHRPILPTVPARPLLVPVFLEIIPVAGTVGRIDLLCIRVPPMPAGADIAVCTEKVVVMIVPGFVRPRAYRASCSAVVRSVSPILICSPWKETGMSKKEIQNHPQLNQPDLI